MLDLRDYKDLVKETLKEVAVNDKNWKWKLKSCKKNEITIWWSYLNEYLEEKKMFRIELEEVEADDCSEVVAYWLWARKPHGGCLDCWDIEPDGKKGEGICGSLSIEDVLTIAVRRIINHALNVY